MLSRLLCILSLILLLSACSKQPLAIEDIVVRPLIPGQTNTAVYFRISNNTAMEKALVAVSSGDAAMMHLHVTETDGDMVGMSMLDKLVIPANQSVSLTPGGMHIMVMGVDAEALSSGSLPMTLTFASGEIIDVVAELEDY